MIRVGVRVLLLSGAAAALALVTRDRLAARVTPLVDRPVHALAFAARELVPRMRPTPPPLAPQPFVPALPVEGPRAQVVLGKPAAKTMPAANDAPHTIARITRKELESAIANGLPGASAVLVKDDDGKPAGLRLAGVGKLAPFGIHDGDVLVSANGLPLRSADEALAALGGLKDAHHVVVVLRRGTSAYSVPVDLVD